MQFVSFSTSAAAGCLSTCCAYAYMYATRAAEMCILHRTHAYYWLCGALCCGARAVQRVIHCMFAPETHMQICAYTYSHTLRECTAFVGATPTSPPPTERPICRNALQANTRISSMRTCDYVDHINGIQICGISHISPRRVRSCVCLLGMCELPRQLWLNTHKHTLTRTIRMCFSYVVHV